ncbi:MAG: hypothetical protein AAFX87_11765 [Bacteroidota bacterium]
MNRFAYLLFFSLSLTSCATLLNSKYAQIEVQTLQDSTTVCIGQDTCSMTPTTFILSKEAKTHTLTFIKDTLEKQVVLKRKLSPNYLFPNVMTYFTGYLIDLGSKKRFWYGTRRIIVDLEDSVINRKRGYAKFNPEKREKINLYFGFPQGNFLKVFDGRNVINEDGFLGFFGGVEYFYSQNKFVSFEANSVLSYPAPFPIPLLCFDGCDLSNTISLSLNHNNKFRRFYVGYGFNYTQALTLVQNQFNFERAIARSSGLGLSFNSSYRFSERFHVRIAYLPVFYTFDERRPNFSYGHTVSLGAMWKFSLSDL